MEHFIKILWCKTVRYALWHILPENWGMFNYYLLTKGVDPVWARGVICHHFIKTKVSGTNWNILVAKYQKGS